MAIFITSKEYTEMNELRSPAYWVGHLFTIAATIIGVYYAAITGFEVALDLEELKADRETYYVTKSIYHELDFNVKNLNKYVKRVEKEQFVYREHVAGIKINKYIFNASKRSESLFEIEPQLLSEISTYYFSVGEAIDFYYESGMQSPGNLMKVVREEADKLKEQKTFERLAEFNKEMSESIQARGVDLSQKASLYK